MELSLDPATHFQASIQQIYRHQHKTPCFPHCSQQHLQQLQHASSLNVWCTIDSRRWGISIARLLFSLEIGWSVDIFSKREFEKIMRKKLDDKTNTGHLHSRCFDTVTFKSQWASIHILKTQVKGIRDTRHCVEKATTTPPPLLYLEPAVGGDLKSSLKKYRLLSS